jgi:hypothetical protein
MRILVMIFLMLCASNAAAGPVIAAAVASAGVSTGIGVFGGKVLVAGALKYFAAQLLGNLVGGHSNRERGKRGGGA